MIDAVRTTFPECRPRAPRFPLAIPVTLAVGNDDLVGGISRNVSVGGMFIELEEASNRDPVEDWVGRQVTITFEIPEQPESIVVEASVRWTSSDNGIGVQFLALAEFDRQSLQRLFASRLAP